MIPIVNCTFERYIRNYGIRLIIILLFKKLLVYVSVYVCFKCDVRGKRVTAE